MPWRGPEVPGEFPTLGYVIADWIEDRCAVPDRHVRGTRFVLSDEQLEHLLWEYRLHPDATVDLDRPSAPFVYVGSVLVRSQKWGKSPFDAARVCAQGAGPVLFAGWNAQGEPVGMPWPTPHIQVTAISEDQAKNVWQALLPMIELGAIADWIQDTGQQQIYLPDGGLIERVTSSAVSRLGQRVTYVCQDQLESWLARNNGHALADNQRRNVAGIGGRWSASANAWDPTQQSQVQLDVEGVRGELVQDVYVNYPEPLPGSWANKRERRRILNHAYRGAPWVDIDRIMSECNRLDAKKDPGQAERFFGNRIVAGAAKAFDLEAYTLLRNNDLVIEPGRLATLGFDGALTRDGTGLVLTDVESGHQIVLGYWERPRDLPPEEPWTVPVDEVDATVEHAFATWDIWRGHFDPPHWLADINRWAGRHGEDRVVLFWTNSRRRMAYALKQFATDMRPGVMSYGGALADQLERHIGNAVKRPTQMRDEDDGTLLWLIGKDGQNSPRRVDLAVCATLSWDARGLAIRAGALNRRRGGRFVTF
jgi:hypothetical protein